MAEEEYKGARNRLSRMFGLKGRVAPFGGSVGTPPPPPIIPIQNFTNNLVGAYSLRRITQNAAFSFSVTNASQTSAYSATFNVNGDLDVPSLQSWINSNLPGPFYITSWFDQSGIVSNADNFPGIGGITISNCPAIADASGNIFTQNGKPCIRFGLNNTPTWLSIGYQQLNAKYFVLSNVAQGPNIQSIFTVPTNEFSFNSFSRGSVIYSIAGSSIYSSEQLSASGTARNTASILPPSRLLFHSQHNTTTLATDLRFNGGIVPPSSLSASGFPSAITNMHLGNDVSGDIFAGWSVNSYFIGDMQEVLLYSQPQEIYINGLTANIMQYWGL